jgi:hypothetical protein
VTYSTQNSSVEDYLAGLGLSTGAIGNPDIEHSLRRLFEAPSSHDRTIEAQAVFDIIRNIRQARRFDLLLLCNSLLSDIVEDAKITREMILLYIDAEVWPILRHYLELRPDVTIELSSHTVLQLVSGREASSMPGFEIWPNESLGYAAKTAVLNVSAAVVTRQRSFIDALLNRIAGEN